MSRPVVLVVLEGWGLRPEVEGNAIALAHKPNFDTLWRECPHTALSSCSIDVGMPPGVRGCLEAGYLTLGAGRVVPSENVRLSELVESGAFADNPRLKKLLAQVRQSGKRLHLIGLVSEGNVHSRDSHWLALIDLARRSELRPDQLVLHALLDGRDAGPRAGLTQIARLMAELITAGTGVISTLVGRSYAMDRDGHWDRTTQAAQLLTHGRGVLARTPIDGVRKGYDRGESDATLSPTSVLSPDGRPYPPLHSGDAVIHFNLSLSRSRQLHQAMIRGGREGATTEPVPDLHWHWLTGPADEATAVPLFSPTPLKRPLLGVLKGAGRRVTLCHDRGRAELMRYHFTGYQSKCEAQEIPGETSSLEPAWVEEMLEHLRLSRPDLMVISVPDVEEAGHTASMSEAVAAVERVDRFLGDLRKASQECGADLVVTSTHGNAEQMINLDTRGPYPAHTSSPVPLLLADFEKRRIDLRADGTLADVAPTILAMMGIDVPSDMEGMDLRVRTARTRLRTHPRFPKVHPETLAAIEAGLREEVDSARFYVLAAATARDQESRDLCLRLAHDEEEHLTMLLERYESLTGARLEIPPSPPVAADVPSIFDLSVVEILDAAIENEAGAFRMFQNLAGRAGDTQASSVLIELAAQEEEHVARLKQAREAAAVQGRHYRIPARLH